MTDKQPSNEPPGPAPDEADAERSSKLELPVALEPTIEEQAAAAPAEAPRDAAFTSVSRFIADLETEPEELPADAIKLEEDDEPTRAYNGRAMAGLDTTRRSIPPALPPEATMLPRPDELPNVMLGPALSMRGDPTERIDLLPRTHPLANSIAPGGSAVTVPPARTRAPRRWPLALGAAALLALSASGALLLQSRGEQHARSRATTTSSAHAARQAPAAKPEPATTIAERLPRSADDTRASESTAVAPAEMSSSAAAPALPSATPAANELAAPARGPGPSRVPPRSQLVRVAMGTARMQPGEQPAMAFPAGDLARQQVKVALGGYREQVRACVGDAHGIADVAITVQRSGVVSHALVEGTFAGSPAGSCIARTLRSVRLPPVAEPNLRVTYPFRL